jgi:hypothetical protein
MRDNRISAFKEAYTRLGGLFSGRAVSAGVFMLLAIIAVLYAFPLKDNDLWWQMKLGEYMLEHKTLVLDQSIYSWTIADPNWVYNCWIPQILLHVLYSIGGVFALHAVNYAVVLFVIALFIIYLKAAGQRLSFFHLLMLLLMVTAYQFSSDLKPETFSFVLLNAAVFIYFYSLERQKDIFWLYPILMLTWVNTHGVFLFGYVLLAILAAGESANFLMKQSNISLSALKKLIIASIVCLPALVITPYGEKWITSLVKSFGDPEFMRQAQGIAAYRSVFVYAHPAKYIMAVMTVSFIALMLFKIKRSRKVDFAVTGLNAAFIYFSFMYARSAYFYLPVWLYTMAWLVKSMELESFIKRHAASFAASFLVISIMTAGMLIYMPRDYKYTGFGVSEYMPDKAADFLLQHKLHGRIFNTYDIGGYLIWRLYPHYKVFIDPRHGPYYKNLIDEYRSFEVGNDFKAFTDKYPFDLAVVKITWNQLLKNFYFSQDWKLLFFDQSAALFVKKDYDTSKIPVDMKPDRFHSLKSYQGIFYVMNLYFIMEDYDSARYMLNLLKSKYNYGIYKDSIISVEDLLKRSGDKK